MYILLVILVVLLAALMIGVVLIQESKGGGLSSTFSDYKRIIGVSKSASVVERTTWILAGIIVLICVVCSYVV